ncbi:MAG: hypothetical protein QW407_03720 [Thermofilaceae archaeon]
MIRGRQEVYWVVGHLVSLEEHLFEAGDLQAVLEAARHRRAVMRLLVEGKSEEWVRRWWCVVKHACALLVHLEEVAAQLEGVDESILLAVHNDLLRFLDAVLGESGG